MYPSYYGRAIDTRSARFASAALSVEISFRDTLPWNEPPLVSDVTWSVSDLKSRSPDQPPRNQAMHAPFNNEHLYLNNKQDPKMARNKPRRCVKCNEPLNNFAAYIPDEEKHASNATRNTQSAKRF